MQTVYLSIGTSLVASIVFWFFFNHLPQKQRYNQVRTIVEYDIVEICTSLFSYVQVALQTSEQMSIPPQDKINAGLVSKEDFELWLQNKCLNQSYKFDERGVHFITIGDKLERYSVEVGSRIEKCSTYYSFMTADEIILLRKIYAKILGYSYTDRADMMFAGCIYRPICPNLTYLAKNFKEANELLNELQAITYRYRRIDNIDDNYGNRCMRLREASVFYTQGKYKRCYSTLKKVKTLDKKRTDLMFKCLYKLEKYNKAYEALDYYIVNIAQKPISIRHTLSEFYHDDRVMNILMNHFSEIEIAEMIEELNNEQKIINNAIEEARETKRFYDEVKLQNDREAKQRVEQKYKKIEQDLKSQKSSPLSASAIRRAED